MSRGRRRSAFWGCTASTDGGNYPMNRLKVLMIAPIFFFADYGCQVRIYEEASILQKMAHEITICSCRSILI